LGGVGLRVRCPVCGRYAKQIKKGGKVLGGFCDHGSHVVIFDVKEEGSR